MPNLKLAPGQACNITEISPPTLPDNKAVEIERKHMPNFQYLAEAQLRGGGVSE